tara:strand:+ start:177 stop:653 length:477 start_codon:yes stop_codon:yes gene_type:complete
MRIDFALLDEISEDLKDVEAEFFWDTLDGETDVLDVVNAILKNKFDNIAHINMNVDIANEYKSRAHALETKDMVFNKQLMKILNVTKQSKILAALATVSRRKGMESLAITDEAKIPSQLCNVVTSPDKSAIKKLLQQGETIDGAELTRGSETISIRRK